MGLGAADEGAVASTAGGVVDEPLFCDVSVDMAFQLLRAFLQDPVYLKATDLFMKQITSYKEG